MVKYCKVKLFILWEVTEMSTMDKIENVKQQYSNDKNLSVRTKLHLKHSTNKQGFVTWLFDKYEFSENCRILELGCGNGGQ